MFPPAVPTPTAEERLFTNWSSEGSPRERVNQQIQLARSVESRKTINQTEQMVREPGDDKVKWALDLLIGRLILLKWR